MGEKSLLERSSDNKCVAITIHTVLLVLFTLQEVGWNRKHFSENDFTTISWIATMIWRLQTPEVAKGGMKSPL